MLVRVPCRNFKEMEAVFPVVAKEFDGALLPLKCHMAFVAHISYST